MPHGGLRYIGETGMIGSLVALTSSIHHLEVHHGHGYYPPTTQFHVQGLKI